jgi:Kyakuja-Dileera-Zisupton transposase
MVGIAQVDREGVERCWSNLNGAAHSMREMGPGSQRDTINDHCAHANWHKVVNIGTCFSYP